MLCFRCRHNSDRILGISLRVCGDELSHESRFNFTNSFGSLLIPPPTPYLQDSVKIKSKSAIAKTSVIHSSTSKIMGQLEQRNFRQDNSVSRQARKFSQTSFKLSSDYQTFQRTDKTNSIAEVGHIQPCFM